MKIRWIAALMALMMLLSLCACGKQKGESEEESRPVKQGEEYPVELRDTVIRTEPEKVVSLSPALTDLLQDMGLQDKLAGISDYCDAAGLEDLTRCGTPQQVDFDAIGKTGAKLVVTSTALAKDDTVKLQQMDVDVVVLPRAATLDELEAVYVDLGRAVAGNTAGRQKGQALWDDFSSRLDSLADRGKAYAETKGGAPTVIFLRMLDYTMATGDTLENKLLEKMGFKNLAAEYGDWTYPQSAAAALTPDLIISDQAITIPVLEKNAVYKGTQAVIKDRVVTVDSACFERQTPAMLDDLGRVADFLFDGKTDARTAQDSSAPSADEGSSSQQQDASSQGKVI